MRPQLGRIENTRFHWLGGYIEYLWRPLFRRRIKQVLARYNPQSVHIVPHTFGDFAQIHAACTELKIPVHISIHDDFLYTSGKRPFKKGLEASLQKLWQDAATCFVISEEMGTEYCRRYGERPYLVHTDGCEMATPVNFQPPASELKLYFMGMFNNSYVPNFQSWIAALEKAQLQMGKALPLQFTLRTHGFKPDKYYGRELVNLLPFASSEVVEKELRSQHFLYLPLPFGHEWEYLTKFSLSTKMISYLAAGVPIVYHGPEWSAAGQYLRRNDASIQMNTNDPEAISKILNDALKDPARLEVISKNAQIAARRDFDASMLRDRFWKAVTAPNTDYGHFAEASSNAKK
jgi:glycosyltransferase involved in cell wall biosynthesis